MTEKKPFTLVVAKDGTGDYSTVTEALAALGEEGEPALIYIKKGVYKERLTIRRPFVTFEGEDMNETVITYNLGAKMEMEDGSRRGTFRSYSVLIDTHDFTARNLTFENSAGLGALVGQALALYVDGDRILFDRCRMLASREINGYVTAASTPEGQEYGYVFEGCHFTGNCPPRSVYLGRPWRNFAKTVLLHCRMEEHIRREGWHDWGKREAHDTLYFAEAGSTGPGAVPEERPEWVRILSEDELEPYSRERVLGGNDGWMSGR